MPLFPLDIKHQEFSGQMFGYSKKEVRLFLDQVATELEELLNKQEKELARREQLQYDVKQEAVSANSAVEDLKRREELISRTLVFAEKTKADIVANARKEAENIIQEAELKAKRAINEAKQHLGILEHQYLSLKEQKRQFLLQFQVELQTFQDRISKDPLLTKNPDKPEGEFKQLKEEISPNPPNGENK